MESPEVGLRSQAGQRYGLCARPEVLAKGCTDRMIANRLKTRRWERVQTGVYRIGPVRLDWRGRLAAAVLAAGARAVASHRAAMVLWGLDGVRRAGLEITVPVTCGPIPAGTAVHRTRRPIPSTVVESVPVTTVERTLLDVASCLPAVVVEKALESALRRHLTILDEVARELEERGGRGVRGTKLLRRILASRQEGRPAGSPAEVELLAHLREMDIPQPIRQYLIPLPDGSMAVTDLGWPSLRKAVEVDGLGAHGSADALDYDLHRQNLILATGHELRRYSARQVVRNPGAVARQIGAFLNS